MPQGNGHLLREELQFGHGCLFPPAAEGTSVTCLAPEGWNWAIASAVAGSGWCL